MRRIIILTVTIVAAILVVALGAPLYVSKNSKLSKEYGGGAEYVIKIVPEGSHKTDKAKAIATDVAESIYNRINALGISGATANAEISSDGARVRVTYPGVTTQEEKDKIEKIITQKPTLTLTDVYGNPLFKSNQNFYSSLVGSNGHVISSDSPSVAPISSGGAKAILVNGEWKVQISVIPSKVSEWYKATQYIAGLSNAKNKGQNQIVAWINIKDFIKELKGKYPSIWSSSGQNPVVAAKTSNGALRTHTVQAEQYIISQASIKQGLAGRTFVIEGHFSNQQAKSLAQKINYGSSKYSLKTEYSNYISATYGTNAFHKAVIAGLIVFIIIAIFLVANYGLLGALSTISIALYVFITLAIFTVMRGEYSPEAIAALIIGVGMAVDANIITYERLKTEVYSGSSLQKGYKDANRKSLSTIFDANITTLIVAFVLFFFGTRNIIGLSVTLILSIGLTLIVMLGFTRFMATLLVRTKIFDNKQHWLGMRPKFDIGVQKKIDKFDYVKNSKWFTLVSATIFGAALIVMVATAIVAGKFGGGFNLSREFTGGTTIQFVSKIDGSAISAADQKAFFSFMSAHGITKDHIDVLSSSAGVTSLKYESRDVISGASQWKVDFTAANPVTNSNFIQSVTTTEVAEGILRNALIAVGVAIVGIIIYTLIRFKWTYSIAAIVALMHDALIVTGFFVITRMEISPVFIAGLLSIIGYSINDTIVTFDRLRENTNLETGEITQEKIKALANKSIKETLKRSLLTSFTTILSVVILMSFGNATKMSFNLAMLVGLVAGTYSSIFIATYLWTKLEWRRQKAIKTRQEKSFWDTPGVDEQTFKGINDFTS